MSKRKTLLKLYFNKIRSLKNHGLLPQSLKNKKNVEKETRSSMELNSEISNLLLLIVL